MKRIIAVAATLLTAAGALAATAEAGSASTCEPNGAGCTAAGTYAGPNAVINADYSGFKVVWTESVVQPYSSGVPLYWTAYMTYTNISSSTLTLGCPGDWTDPAFVSEYMSGGSGDDGLVSAGSTICSEDPDENQPVASGASFTAWAAFHNVPWPGSAVAITWGDAGRSAAVYPFGTSTPPPPPTHSPPPPAPAQPSCPAASSPSWAGYVVCGSHLTSVHATWTVPAAHGGGYQGAAFWAGLGGLGNVPLEQLGTTSNVEKGRADYQAWWEIVPFDPVFLSAAKYPVHPGDTMTAMVQLAHGDQYTMVLRDSSRHRNWTFFFVDTFPGGNHASAEVVVEDSDGRHLSVPLTNFGSVTFSQVEVNNSVMAPYRPTQYTFGGGRVSVSQLGSGAQFSVKYRHS